MDTWTHIGACIVQNRALLVERRSHFDYCSYHFRQNLQSIDEKVANRVMHPRMGCEGRAVRIQDGQPYSKNLEERRAEKKPRFLMVVGLKERSDQQQARVGSS